MISFHRLSIQTIKKDLSNIQVFSNGILDFQLFQMIKQISQIIYQQYTNQVSMKYINQLQNKIAQQGKINLLQLRINVYQQNMLEKFVQNFMAYNPSRQITHANSMNNRSRDQAREELPDLLMRKVKSAQWDIPRLVVSMWETQSTFEMFDYENKAVKTKQHKLESDHDIYISNPDKRYAKCIVTRSTMPNDNVYCGSVERSKGQFYFISGTQLECYKVIGRQSGQVCQLKTGDLIRIGRMKYFIKETFDGYENKAKQFERNSKAKQLKIQSLQSGTCKFCLCDQKDNPDLLISPCNCKGSCAQVHVQCLKQWLTNKVSRKSTSFVEFLNYDNFSCQICKQDLPTSMKVDDKYYNMLKSDNKQRDPYIVLEGIPNEKSSTKNNMTITIKFGEKNSLVIGRGHEADIKLEDVSISRQHCILKFTNRRFELIDNDSKFGTLIKIQKGQKVNLNIHKVQVARMTLQTSKTGSQPKDAQNFRRC